MTRPSLPTLLALAICVVALGPAQAAESAPRPKAGDVLWRLDLSDQAKLPGGLPEGAAWVQEGPKGQTCYRLTVPADRAKGQNLVRIPLDVTPWRGMSVTMTALAKAVDVTKPEKAYNGIKCMLHCSSKIDGDIYANEGRLFGSFDWKTITTSPTIPEDATGGELMLGLQDSSGTVLIADVVITAKAVKPLRPAPRADAPPAYTGHDLPRLRGVMSPNAYREQDFVDLAAMNVNAVRWQLNRNWGKEGSDRDLAEYDRWLDGRLDELALALEAGRKHGIKLMIDLHALPGGRLPDKTLSMLVEQPYQDHFVKIWQRIATRFKGHPAIWAYDLVNEPIQNKPSPPGLLDWYALEVKTAKAIRTIDPTTAICIEPDVWADPQRYAWIDPVDVPNVIYQIHMYWPGTYTHQGVYNAWGVSPGKEEAYKPMPYPGTYNSRPLDKEALRRYLQPAREFQLAFNVQIVAGEFSAARWAPGADRYLADLTDIFEEYGWDWTYHAFREWGGWSFEAADQPYDRNSHPKADSPTKRAQVLMSWFAKNVRKPGGVSPQP